MNKCTWRFARNWRDCFEHMHFAIHRELAALILRDAVGAAQGTAGTDLNRCTWRFTRHWRECFEHMYLAMHRELAGLI